MRNFVVVFLFFIFGITLGKDSEKVSSMPSVVPAAESKNNMTVSGQEDVLLKSKNRDNATASDLDVVFSKLKNADKETLVVFNCEGVVFSYSDAAFSKENKHIWSDFYEKRLSFDREKNKKIDRALLFAPKKIIDMNYLQNFKALVDRGINMVFVYQIDENKIKFPEEGMIRSVVSSILEDVGMNLNENPSVKLLITDSKKFSRDLTDIVVDFSKSESKSEAKAKSGDQADNKTKKQLTQKVNPVNKIILVHEGSLKIDSKQINLPMEEMLVNFKGIKGNITENQAKKQIEILGKIGEWMHDGKIQEITDCATDEDKIYMLCKQSIIDVCPCAEIMEEKIYEKIASVVTNENSLKNLEEIIDYFQEINNTLPNIFHYALRKYLWEICHKLGIEGEKAIKVLKEMKSFPFNEYEVQSSVHKVVKRLGCGIHWRDIAKYEFAEDFIMTGGRMEKMKDSLKNKEHEKVTTSLFSMKKLVSSSRYKTYMKVMGKILDKVHFGINRMVEDQKNELIRILHENKIEDSKIMGVFNISEEKFKNIISVKDLKNEGNNKRDIKKIEKLQKTT